MVLPMISALAIMSLSLRSCNKVKTPAMPVESIVSRLMLLPLAM